MCATYTLIITCRFAIKALLLPQLCLESKGAFQCLSLCVGCCTRTRGLFFLCLLLCKLSRDNFLRMDQSVNRLVNY